jgi:hypothetical protein
MYARTETLCEEHETPFGICGCEKALFGCRVCDTWDMPSKRLSDAYPFVFCWNCVRTRAVFEPGAARKTPGIG